MCCQADRAAVLEQLQQKQQRQAALEVEVQKYKDCDPEVMEEMQREAGVAKDAANRWTGEAAGRE